MLRRLATTALLATTVAAAAAPAAGADELAAGQPSPAKMEQAIKSVMAGNAFGFQYAIAQNGMLARSGGGGWALSDADNGGNRLAMAPTMRMELASVTKNLTAVLTLKLLRLNGLNIESPVNPYLPHEWDRGPGFNTAAVKFRHLLTHTSGIYQALAAMPNPPADNGWEAMRTVVDYGTQPDSPRVYKNANYALLRVINSELWRRYKGFEVPVDEITQSTYALDAMRKLIFEPIGLKSVGCQPLEANPAKSYAAGATQQSLGQVLATSDEECAGARGIRLSAVELVRYAANLRHGSLLPQADRDVMDSLRAGWDENSNLADTDGDGKPQVSDSAGAFWHGGDLTGTLQQHTCVITFADGTEATLIVNSPLTTARTQCGVLLTAHTAGFAK